MNPQEYTLSGKDKKFLVVLMCAHLSLVMLAVSAFGLYYHKKNQDCREIIKQVQLSKWAMEQVNKKKMSKRLK